MGDDHSDRAETTAAARAARRRHNITYSFIANCQTAVVHKNKTKRRFKIYKSQYILRYNILTENYSPLFEKCGQVAVYCEVYF